MNQKSVTVFLTIVIASVCFIISQPVEAGSHSSHIGSHPHFSGGGHISGHIGGGHSSGGYSGGHHGGFTGGYFGGNNYGHGSNYYGNHNHYGYGGHGSYHGYYGNHYGGYHNHYHYGYGNYYGGYYGPSFGFSLGFGVAPGYGYYAAPAYPYYGGGGYYGDPGYYGGDNQDYYGQDYYGDNSQPYDQYDNSQPPPDQQYEQPSAHTQTIYLQVNPSDASVYIDGQYYGTASGSQSGSIEAMLTNGRHRIEAVRPGYVPYDQEVEVGPGYNNNVTITLQSR